MKKNIDGIIYSFLRWIKYFCLLAFFLWFIGFALFIWQATAPSSEDKKSFPIKADAIVVLTGGKGRIEEGARLLKQGVAKILFVSGVAKGVREGDLAQYILHNKKEISALQEVVDLGYEARDTRENAEEIRRWVFSLNQKLEKNKENIIKKIIIVTSAYHMPRSLLEIKEKLPSMNIIPYPVYATIFKEEGWWRRKKTLLFAFREYNKYIAVETRIFLRKVFDKLKILDR